MKRQNQPQNDLTTTYQRSTLVLQSVGGWPDPKPAFGGVANRLFSFSPGSSLSLSDKWSARRGGRT